MVAKFNQYIRWDFLGLSTDTKPTPATSEDVTDGSTYYEVDTSKLYVYCKDNWYEKEDTGGGGGGASDFEALELVIDLNDGTVSTTKTVREIISMYTSGKCFSSSMALDPNPESLICLQIFYGTLIYLGSDDGYLMTAFTHSPESIVRLEFSAADLDSVFTAQLPN